jgi:endoglucanase Acf2
VLQGWLPHQWRSTRHQLKLAQSEFASPRGRLRLAPGSSFEIAWPFRGVVPSLPAPGATPPGGSPYDAAKMAQWIAAEAAEYASKDAGKRAGDDTYWGGKATLKMVQIWTIAEEMQHPAAAQLRGFVREAMTDWYTWTPGESARYFCRYPPPWSGLVGLKTSFGSGSFTDNHFHYGYHTLAAAMLGRFDPAWLASYGPMARLVAKQFANWERDDKDFPLLRTFDIWHGHSYAGGMSNANDGNNQESTSESMQSWAGLFLLGSAMGDKEMTATGAMGYAIESSAVMEYWFDYYGWKDPAAANHPPAYKAKHTMASVVRDRDIGYWTWFSGRAIHVYGIQFIPTWHWMQYLGGDAAFMGWQVESMAKRESKSDSTDLLKLGDDWGILACIGALSFSDPRRVTALFDQAAKTSARLDGRNALIQYWVAHTYQSVGTPATDAWTDLPTSSVYRRNDGSLTVVAWNPGAQDAEIGIWRQGRKVGSARISAGSMAMLRDLPFLKP